MQRELREQQEQGAATRTKADIRQAYEAHVRTVYRVCYGVLTNAQDAEDATQETFVRLMRYDGTFDGDEHVKAWLIRVATNVCKDVLKSAERKRRAAEALDEVPEPAAPAEEQDTTLEVVLGLPERLRDVVYLYYYEGYTSAEIARMLDRRASTVRNTLAEARAVLREKLGGEWQ